LWARKVADIYALITSSGKNADYCKLALDSLLAQDCNERIVATVVDFSNQPDKFEFAQHKANYSNREGCGFCSNVNYGMGMATLLGAEYYLYINDDVRLPVHFVRRGIETLQCNDVGFVSGVQQTTDLVQIPANCLKDLHFPNGADVTVPIDDLMGKWGDFSAWIARTDVMIKVGGMDMFYDPVGIIADNDYVLRLRKAGFRPARDYGMMYLHAKGVTQREHRPGWPNDEVLNRARTYFRQKWGVDPYTGNISDVYEREFDAKNRD
jgi:GT2 family glycosyltransferase